MMKKETDFKETGRFGHEDKDMPMFKLDAPTCEACKNCKYRHADRANGVIKGYVLGECEKYWTKPDDVMWHGGECEEYEKEEKKFDRDFENGNGFDAKKLAKEAMMKMTKKEKGYGEGNEK